MKKGFIVILFFLLANSNGFCQLSGYIVDSLSKEKLSYVTIINLNSKASAISNKYGFFSIKAIVGDTIRFSMVGYKTSKVLISIKNQLGNPQNVLLSTSVYDLNIVFITGKKESIINQNEPGKIFLQSKQIKELTMLLGEKDPIKALSFMPGIQEVSEGSSSLSIRGGDVNQNLLLLDEAIVYNANHLFGFFSTFNADPIEYLDAYKGPFPAQYGGRLSSIIDIKMREGNRNRYNIEGGIGLISSRLLVEGPIIKNNSSFLFAARRTYLDLFLKPFQSNQERTSYYFGDLNFKINTKINHKNDLFISYYSGIDDFYQKNKIPRRNSYLLNNTLLDWKNYTLTSRWNRIYSSKLFQNVSFLYTKYQMGYSENTIQDYLLPPRFQEVTLKSGIKDYTLKSDIDYFVSGKFTLKTGGLVTIHKFNPREFSYISSRGEESFKNNSKNIQNIEIASFVTSKLNLNNYTIDAGIRSSFFDVSKKIRIEPRLLLTRKLGLYKSISVSYSKMNQYLHQISNTGNGLPTDAWIPSSSFLKPGVSDIVSFNLSFPISKMFIASFDTYYKWIKGNTEYKSGVNFLGVGQGAATMPFTWETSLTQGKAWNYGYELTIQKTKGKITGFGGYTLAWAISKFNDLNEGKPFYSRQDRRHVLELSINFRPSKRNSFSGNFFFATGNPLSIPEKVFFRQDKYNNYLELYSGINSFRAESSHRLDISYTRYFKKGKSNLEFGIYNSYFRKNPYNYDIKDIFNQSNRTQKVVIERNWLFPLVPSIMYNFKI